MDDEVIFHPAGLDAELRGAVTDLQAGRWMFTRELLARTGTDWPLRTARSQVLASAAARSDVLEHWAREDPDNTDLVVLRARVAVLRALAAAQAGRPEAGAMHGTAREACWQAARIAPADPVPWVAMLELAVLDPGQLLKEHGGDPPDALLPAGPWWLLAQLQRRDPYSREGHHRMLRWWLHCGGRGYGQDFVHWLLGHAPAGSPLRLLPLYLRVERYRTAPRREALVNPWMQEAGIRDTESVWEHWFLGRASEARSVPDLSHLAHALWAGNKKPQAARVFEVLGPLGSRQPWESVANPRGGHALLLDARGQAARAVSRT
ncbi:hypothetical protein OG455_37640 [Kitasatospora sp. NBC_01287]|uniref:hypothetical protein n=1 Tax=Kitasatospora sp. NBC_01287 TaxID=2903573 RepID=UPI00224F3D1E|nr:hypothetical protein [Kitasatospora sp. NBC_01287]MCX4751165.1 hypothetical protein [Kitasatospora sp. NBC_01287]